MRRLSGIARIARATSVSRMLPSTNWPSAAKAFASVSYTRSSASARLRVSRSALEHSSPACGMATCAPRPVRDGKQPTADRCLSSAVPAVDTPMRGCDSVTVAAGDLFVIETRGGGGYGAPVR
jgi:N-methylhydantoinase B/oxoprolinase/acetone carboxylase alpha subunit